VTEISFNLNFPNDKVKFQKCKFQSGIHIIYGESGSGKSSLCLAIAKMNKINSISNFQLSKLNGFKTIMLVNQNPDTQIVAPTIERELSFNFENMGLNSKEIINRIKSIKNEFLFSFSMDQHPETLSGGEREILNLSTAISVSPELLLLDDSFSFLNNYSKEKYLILLHKWQRKVNSVILWFTSNQKDLHLSNNRWIFEKNKMSKVTYNLLVKPLPKSKLSKGSLTIELNKLHFSFPNRSKLFSNISCKIGPFRSLGIIGSNGCGKSTLAFLIANIIKPTSGNIKIELNGKKPKIGLISQCPERNFGGYTPNEIIEMLILDRIAKEETKKEIEITLDNFLISWKQVSNIIFENMALFESRIVLLVLISLCDYNLIIFDEPMFSLGRNLRNKMIRFLDKILTDKYLIMITHNEDELKSICDKSIQINKDHFLIT
tara:strand:+ start:4225 stop:5523 length:1299 start_codon:yes stop_codon:yes gene_type:complete